MIKLIISSLSLILLTGCIGAALHATGMSPRKNQQSEIDKCVYALVKEGQKEGDARLNCLQAANGKKEQIK